MFNKARNLAVLSVLGLAAFAPGIGVTEAFSFPVVAPSTAVGTQSNEIVPVQFMQGQNMGHRGGWQSGRDGNRCLTRMGNCQHFHQGYYYQNPWWILPLVVGGAIAATNNAGGSHVQWCLSHYRSYDVRTDTWLGNSGRRYRCNSGY